MLRILVISFFVANLLLLGFHRSEPAPEPETRATRTEDRDSSIPTIHLFKEMIQDQGLLSGNRQCFSLGPFHSSEDKDETHTRLLEVSNRINERQTQALVEKGYWVFMPPYKTLLEANEELISLQALGLKDISILYDGEWKNAISLGYFMRQANATRRKNNLQDRGYEPLMRVLREAEPRYWLDYEQTPGSELIALDMQNRPNDFMRRALPCPEEDLFETTDPDSQEPAEELAQLKVSEPVESSRLEAEDPVEDVDAAELIESPPQEAEDLVQQQIPEQENDSSQDPVEDVNIAELIESPPQEAEDLDEDVVEDVAEDENLDGPPQEGD